MDSPLKAAALQMATTDEIDRNAARIADAVRRSAEEGARLLVVPECALSGYLPADDLDFDALRASEQELARLAAEAHLWLALGTTRRDGDDWFNSALLYSPAGRVVARYDKTHGTSGDNRKFSPGRSLPVFAVGEWQVGLQICFDMRFPENWRILRLKGAELVIHLSNASRSAGWKVPVLEGTVRSRAAENGMFVVSANDARRPQMLVSAVCDPLGKHLAAASENEEGLIFAELDRTLVRSDYLDSRRTDLWSRLQNRDLLIGPLEP